VNLFHSFIKQVRSTFRHIWCMAKIFNSGFTPHSKENEFWSYKIYCNHSTRHVYTREKPREHNRKISPEALLSHIHHGVDNTGLVRVWTSEQILLHVMLRRDPERLRHKYVFWLLGLC